MSDQDQLQDQGQPQEQGYQREASQSGNEQVPAAVTDEQQIQDSTVSREPQVQDNTISRDEKKEEEKKEEVEWIGPPRVTRFSTYDTGLINIDDQHIENMFFNLGNQMKYDKKHAEKWQQAKITTLQELRKTTMPATGSQDKKDHLLFLDGICIANDLDNAYFYRHSSGRILQGQSSNVLNQAIPIPLFYKVDSAQGAGHRLRLNNKEFSFSETLADDNYASVDILQCIEEKNYEVMVSKYNYTIYIMYRQETQKDSDSYRERIKNVRYFLLKLENLLAQMCGWPDIFLNPESTEPLQFAQLVNGTRFFRHALKCFILCKVEDLPQLYQSLDAYENVAFAFILQDFDFGSETDREKLRAIECFNLVNLVYDEASDKNSIQASAGDNSILIWYDQPQNAHPSSIVKMPVYFKSLDEASKIMQFPLKYRPSREFRILIEPTLIQKKDKEGQAKTLVTVQLANNFFRIVRPKRSGLDCREFIVNQKKTSYVLITKNIKEFAKYQLFQQFTDVIFLCVIDEKETQPMQNIHNQYFIKLEQAGDTLDQDAYVQFGDQLDVFCCSCQELIHYMQDFLQYVKLFNKQVDITSIKTYFNLSKVVNNAKVNGIFILQFNNFKETSTDKPIIRHEDAVFFYGLELTRMQGKELNKDFETVFIQIPSYVVQNPAYAAYYQQVKKNMVSIANKAQNYNMIIYIDDDSPVTGFEDIMVLKPDRQFRVIALRAGIYGKTILFEKQESNYCKVSKVMDNIPEVFEDIEK